MLLADVKIIISVVFREGKNNFHFSSFAPFLQKISFYGCDLLLHLFVVYFKEIIKKS